MGSMIVGMYSVSQACQINDRGNFPVSANFLPPVNGGLHKVHLMIIMTAQRKKRSNSSLRSDTTAHFIFASNLLLSICFERAPSST